MLASSNRNVRLLRLIQLPVVFRPVRDPVPLLRPHLDSVRCHSHRRWHADARSVSPEEAITSSDRSRTPWLALRGHRSHHVTLGKVGHQRIALVGEAPYDAQRLLCATQTRTSALKAEKRSSRFRNAKNHQLWSRAMGRRAAYWRTRTSVQRL